MRFVHAARNVGSVDVSINGARVFDERRFKSITDYAALSANTVRVQALQHGKLVMNVTAALQPRTDYTLILMPNANGTASPMMLRDDNSLPGEYHTRLRLVQLLPSTSPVLTLTDASATRQKPASIAMSAESGYITLPAGYVSVALNGDKPVRVMLDSDTVYTAFVFNGEAHATMGLSIDAQGIRILLPITGDELDKLADPRMAR
ncbi:MAG: DUF4397 domain-containing protein [Anaerolineae bacterium]|nr:DUF4397 domain-containing protein [Anaerolineae bacterium]